MFIISNTAVMIITALEKQFWAKLDLFQCLRRFPLQTLSDYDKKKVRKNFRHFVHNKPDCGTSDLELKYYTFLTLTRLNTESFKIQNLIFIR